MAEADALPLRDQTRRAAGHLLEQREVRLRRVTCSRVEAVDDEIGKLFQSLVLFGPVEVFERAKAHEARREAGNDRRGLDGFAHDRIIGPGHRQRARSRDAEPMHRLRGEKFADRRTQHRAPVTHARVGGLARSFQLDFPELAIRSGDLAEQQRAAIAKAWHVDTELVARINRGDRFAAGEWPAAGQSCDDAGVCEALGRQPDQCRGRLGLGDEIGLRQRRGRDLGKESAGHAREAVVEANAPFDRRCDIAGVRVCGGRQYAGVQWILQAGILRGPPRHSRPGRAPLDSARSTLEHVGPPRRFASEHGADS